jgi:hypothetical protein
VSNEYLELENAFNGRIVQVVVSRTDAGGEGVAGVGDDTQRGP